MYATFKQELMELARFSHPSDMIAFGDALDRLVVTARFDGEQNGLWLASMHAEEVEAMRGCKSLIAEKIARYRMDRQLSNELGELTRVEA